MTHITRRNSSKSIPMQEKTSTAATTSSPVIQSQAQSGCVESVQTRGTGPADTFGKVSPSQLEKSMQDGKSSVPGQPTLERAKKPRILKSPKDPGQKGESFESAAKKPKGSVTFNEAVEKKEIPMGVGLPLKATKSGSLRPETKGKVSVPVMPEDESRGGQEARGWTESARREASTLKRNPRARAEAAGQARAAQPMMDKLNTIRNLPDFETANTVYQDRYRDGLSREEMHAFEGVLQTLPRRTEEDINAKLELLKGFSSRDQAIRHFEGYMEGLSRSDRKRFDQALKELPRTSRRH